MGQHCMKVGLTWLGGLAMILATGSEVLGASAVTVRDLAGVWSGQVSHDGGATPLVLEIEPDADGSAVLKLTIPAIHLVQAPLGRVAVELDGSHVRLGAFSFDLEQEAATLRGVVPDFLAPVYRLPLNLRRIARLEVPARAELSAPSVQPVWSFDAGSPLWPGTTWADGVVLAGGDDGKLHALDAKTGQERWSFAAQGPIRTRAVVGAGVAYFQADDGFLYALEARSGKQRWRAQVVPTRVVRLPPSDPASRYDRYGSDVAVAGDRLVLGTHDGRVLCLAASDGSRVWEHGTGGSVLAAPVVAGGRVWAGSYDGNVVALDATTGRRVWAHDTGKPVVSTPALAGGRVIVGSRSYDLLGLDAGSGALDWKQYLWFSWVESSPVIQEGVAYLGSSDAAALLAVDAATGRRLWTADVWGWAWAQPAVTSGRVFIGTAAQRGYPTPHRGQALAVDRASGRLVWRFEVPASDGGTYGFTGSPSVGSGRVFFAGLDGRIYAFAE